MSRRLSSDLDSCRRVSGGSLANRTSFDHRGLARYQSQELPPVSEVEGPQSPSQVLVERAPAVASDTFESVRHRVLRSQLSSWKRKEVLLAFFAGLLTCLCAIQAVNYVTAPNTALAVEVDPLSIARLLKLPEERTRNLIQDTWRNGNSSKPVKQDLAADPSNDNAWILDSFSSLAFKIDASASSVKSGTITGFYQTQALSGAFCIPSPKVKSCCRYFNPHTLYSRVTCYSNWLVRNARANDYL